MYGRQPLPYRIREDLPSIDKNAARTVLVSAIATLVTTKPLSASLQRVMAGMKYQI
jgi:hypothetical protein